MKSIEEHRKLRREYMRKYNATEKGAEYNRQHVKTWRQITKSPRSKTRPQTSVLYRNAIIDFLFKRDGTICDLCHLEIYNKNFHIDHKIPWALGGPSTLENFRLVHDKCNLVDAIDIRSQIHGH